MTAEVQERWQPRFFTIWTGQAFSLFGSQLVQFALVWWLTETTRSATVLAAATLVAIVPQVLLGLVIGPLIDRWNRKRVMMIADSLVALTTLGLVLLFAAGRAEIWHVYLVMLIRSAAGSFHFPALQASTSLIVPEAQLARVAGLNQMLQGLMSIVAPPAGALLIGLLPMEGVLAIDIVTALIAVGSLLLIAIPQPEYQPDTASSPLTIFWRDLRGGLRYIRGWAGLSGVIVISMLLNLVITPPVSLVPLMVTNVFGGGAGELAALNSAMGIGVVVGGIVLGVWGGFRRRILTSLFAIFLMSLSFLVVGLTPPSLFGVAVAAFLVSGITQSMANGPVFALLQSVVAPEMQGRVFTLLMSGSALMMPLSLAITGPLADRLGVPTMYVIAGVSCLLISIAAMFIPAVMNIEGNHQPQPNASAPAGAD